VSGAIRECLNSHRGQRLVGRSQLGAGVGAAAFPAQPFAVEELCASEFDPDPGMTESLDRLPVELVGGVIVVQQGPPGRLDAEGQLGAAGAGHRE
jgi:hypothetical protein